MGISIYALHFLLHEHAYRPISGNLLTIGKQGVPLDANVVLSTIESFGITPKNKEFEIDTANQHQDQHRNTSTQITDASFFASFSDCKVQSADISDYEGADYVFDICGSVPEDLKAKFDFIIDGGSLDNVFDPFRMLANMTEMLAPGGRMFIYAWSNSHPTAYAKVSPDWLMDYFAVNEFADCKVYPVIFPHLRSAEQGEKIFNFDVFHFDPYVEHGGQIGYECSSIVSELPMQTHCIAEKGVNSTSGRSAVQKHYRNTEIEPYVSSITRFRGSPRPIFSSPTSVSTDIPAVSDYETVRPVARWQLVR